MWHRTPDSVSAIPTNYCFCLFQCWARARNEAFAGTRRPTAIPPNPKEPSGPLCGYHARGHNVDQDQSISSTTSQNQRLPLLHGGGHMRRFVTPTTARTPAWTGTPERARNAQLVRHCAVGLWHVHIRWTLQTPRQSYRISITRRSDSQILNFFKKAWDLETDFH